MNTSNQYSKIFNLKTGKYQILQAKFVENMDLYQYTFGKNDQIYVHYLQKFFLVFIFKPQCYSILKKNYTIIIQNSTNFNQMEIQEVFQSWIHQKKYQIKQMQNLKNTTIVASQKYLYKGFGIKNQDNQPYFANKIFRFSLQHQFLMSFSNKNVWQNCDFTVVPNQYAKTVIQKVNFSNCQKFQLQRKHSGYGFYDKNNKNVYFMGGYVQAKNEQKISKIICIVSDQVQQNVLNMSGKTKKQLFDGRLLKENIDKKFTLFPFIFGIPFQIHDESHYSFILNTNGFYQNLNNYGKLFMSTMKLSKCQDKCGIAYQTRQPRFQKFISQIKKQVIDNKQQEPEYKKHINRLRSPQNIQQYQLARQKLIQLIIHSTQQINQYKDCVCIQIQEGCFIIRFRLIQQLEEDQKDLKNEKLIQVYNINNYIKNQKNIKIQNQYKQSLIHKKSNQEWNQSQFQLLFY